MKSKLYIDYIVFDNDYYRKLRAFFLIEGQFKYVIQNAPIIIF